MRVGRPRPGHRDEVAGRRRRLAAAAQRQAMQQPRLQVPVRGPGRHRVPRPLEAALLQQREAGLQRLQPHQPSPVSRRTAAEIVEGR